MSPALWLLIRLRFLGWLRLLKRTLTSVKGIIMAVFAVGMMGLWFVSLIVSSEAPTGEKLEFANTIGPFILLAFCLMQLLFSPGERAISFTAAEVNLLFPAPFSRREIILYKIVFTFASASFSAVIFAILFRSYTANFLQGLLGAFLSLMFLQLLAMAIAISISAIGTQAYNRQRKFVLLAIVLLVALISWPSLSSFQMESWQDLLVSIAEHPVVAFFLSPLRWLVQTATATTWQGLLFNSLLGLLANFVMLRLVMALDWYYLEAATNASEKTFQRLQQVRRGGMSTLGLKGKPSFGLPNFPRLGGIGTLTWRQFLSSIRSPWWMLMLVFFGGIFIVPTLLANRQEMGDPQALTVMVTSLIFSMAIFLPNLLTFDFRGDIDRMDFIKSLPLPAWRIVVGQIMAPVLVVTVVQVVLFAILQSIRGEFEFWYFAIIPFSFSLNLVVFAIENFFFLCFPTRQVASGPGDFQTFGRQMVLWILKFITLGILIGVASLVGVIGYFLFFSSLVIAIVLVWCVTTLFAVAWIPLVCWAFIRYDVARDTPP